MAFFSGCAMHAPDASAFMEVLDKEYSKDEHGSIGYFCARGGEYDDKMPSLPSYWDAGGNFLILDYLVGGVSFQWVPIVNLGVGNRFVAFRSWLDFFSLIGNVRRANYGAGLVQQVIPTKNLRFGLEENLTHNSYGPILSARYGDYAYWDLGLGLFSRYHQESNSFSLAVRVQRRFLGVEKISKYGRYLLTASLTVTWAGKK